MSALANDQWSLAKFVHVRGADLDSTRRRPHRIAELVAAVGRRANGYIRGANADPIEGHHRLDRPTPERDRSATKSREPKWCRASAAARLLRTEGDELHRKRCWLPAHHGRQLEHHGNARRIVLRTRCHRHGVEMRADNYVGFVRIETRWFRDHIE